MSAGGFSAYPMVFGPSPLDLCRWDGRDEDLFSAKDTSPIRTIRTAAETSRGGAETALKDVANSKLRRLAAYHKASNFADFAIGDFVQFYKTANR